MDSFWVYGCRSGRQIFTLCFSNWNNVLFFFAGLFFIAYVAGCGGASDDASPGGPSVDVAYVDANIGDDVSGLGTRLSPYKTLTRAFAETVPAGHIEVAPGLYNVESGEVFPIFIPSDTQVNGSLPVDLENNLFAKISGAGTLQSDWVSGENQVTIVLGEGARVQDLIIESDGGVAVWSENRKSDILDCVISNSQVGIAVLGNSVVLIARTLVHDNTDAGIEIHDLAKPILIRNTIISNGTGILILDSADPWLGKNTSSGGINEIKNNINCDLHNMGTADISAVGNAWDDEPFSFTIESVCGAGVNIANAGSGGVRYQYIPPTNTPVFPGTIRIPFGSPEIGELLNTDRPSFNWTSTGAREAVLMVWAQPPEMDSTGAIEPAEMVWVWHSGLGTGFPGAVSFQDGRSAPTGKMNALIGPAALTRGAAYYWAVWEWDESGMYIAASSDLGYFRVSN